MTEAELRRQIHTRIFNTRIILAEKVNAEGDISTDCLYYEPGHGDMFVAVIKDKRYRFGAIEPAISFYADPENATYKGKVEYCSCTCSEADHKNQRCQHDCKESGNGSQSSGQEVSANQSAGTGSSNPEGGNPESQPNIQQAASGVGLEEEPRDEANRSEEPEKPPQTCSGSPESLRNNNDPSRV